MDNNKIIPKHVAIIMDGNRRWAKEKGLPVFDGHWEGYNTLNRITRHCFKVGVKILTVYAFSTENWSRPDREIKVIFRILKHGLNKEINQFVKEGIKVNFIGQLDKFPNDIKEQLKLSTEKTSENNKAILNIAINYGGRTEIVDALKKSVEKGVKASDISEDLVSKNMYNSTLPDPDLIIRTSGEKRLSGFLLWQSEYSELMFVDKFWPDFTEDDFDLALNDYQLRKRRFGK